ncbi:MAG TPA: methyltransferase domain-containing protein [Methyloprofundus sp.]|uniref:class I SAM-dependent methyltransferase n=1 Tax=Methyloprofundus sp. TaxID=2020875 RepID=UPI001850A932|nr:methyltransferase domain-containing protein [Methyloprofundus sp.]HIG65192.1 methyltransferase domain-containing protein [Methyloprofundus sp.]HIL79383.1 methyltransferase domain-containing protein [Methylococcales bacterium]
MDKQLSYKWDKVYQSDASSPGEPVAVLSGNLFLLPQKGTALDLASGLGANALILAKQGLTTQAWDISAIALGRLQQQADAHALPINTFTREITPDSFASCCFDVVVVSRFLDRSICNAIMESLKPNGLLFYQTYTQDKTSGLGPKNPRFLLAENELLQLFSPLKRVYYRENSGLGMIQQGLRNEAQFIGQKRLVNSLSK